MIGYQVYKTISVLVDDYDPDERREDHTVPCSPVYLSEDKAKKEKERLEKEVGEDWIGDPISCHSYVKEYYITPVKIEE